MGWFPAQKWTQDFMFDLKGHQGDWERKFGWICKETPLSDVPKLLPLQKIFFCPFGNIFGKQKSEITQKPKNNKKNLSVLYIFQKKSMFCYNYYFLFVNNKNNCS